MLALVSVAFGMRKTIVFLEVWMKLLIVAAGNESRKCCRVAESRRFCRAFGRTGDGSAQQDSS